MQQKHLSGEAMEAISNRLSSMEDLYFPRAMHDSAFSSDPLQRKSTLHALLSRDPVIFLERYGERLSDDELGHFDALKEDYEVDWHLKRLRGARHPPTEAEVRSRSVVVKNRRRAYMDELIRVGDYFSEEAMREREPYLHHEYVGQFQDPTGRSMSRPGERWSETLMRRSEEAFLVAKIRGEQERLGVAIEEEEEKDEETEEEEEEEEEDDDDDDDDVKNVNGVQDQLQSDQNGGVGTGEKALTAAEMQDQMDQFTHIMQQKFLAGEDSKHLDYSKIDNDETLDDHWLKEVDEDAEEKYFAED